MKSRSRPTSIAQLALCFALVTVAALLYLYGIQRVAQAFIYVSEHASSGNVLGALLLLFLAVSAFVRPRMGYI